MLLSYNLDMRTSQNYTHSLLNLKASMHQLLTLTHSSYVGVSLLAVCAFLCYCRTELAILILARCVCRRNKAFFQCTIVLIMTQHTATHCSATTLTRSKSIGVFGQVVRSGSPILFYKLISLVLLSD